MTEPRPSVGDEELIRVEDLEVHFPVRSPILRRVTAHARAVDGVDLVVHEGQTVGLVGESGSGKTTTGRAIMRMNPPTGGRILFRGRDIMHFDRNQMRDYRRRVQFVFQDPFSSLNPRLTVGELIAEPMNVQGIGTKGSRRHRVVEVLEEVGLRSMHAKRYPHEFSGGQRQRIGIARSLTLSPELLILDEPVSALDVTIQAQVIELLERIQRDLGIAYLFVAHDLAVVRGISSWVAVMNAGRIVEQGPTDAVFDKPQHEYTRMLLDSVPIPDPDLARQKAAERDAAPAARAG